MASQRLLGPARIEPIVLPDLPVALWHGDIRRVATVFIDVARNDPRIRPNAFRGCISRRDDQADRHHFRLDPARRNDRWSRRLRRRCKRNWGSPARDQDRLLIRLGRTDISDREGRRVAADRLSVPGHPRHPCHGVVDSCPDINAPGAVHILRALVGHGRQFRRSLLRLSAGGKEPKQDGSRDISGKFHHCPHKIWGDSA